MERGSGWKLIGFFESGYCWTLEMAAAEEVRVVKESRLFRRGIYRREKVGGVGVSNAMLRKKLELNIFVWN